MPADGTTKAWLRKEALQKRKALPADEVIRFNKGLLSLFSTLPFSGIHYLHSFFPIATRYEPDTLLLLKWLREHHPGIRVVFPKSDFTTSSMRHFLWDGNTVMKVSAAGIPEPVGGTEIAAGRLDMVLVPLLAVDMRGNRVGYGKGFYDRFLAQCRPDVQKIGLSFFDPVPAIGDVSPFDIRLDACITPGKIWHF